MGEKCSFFNESTHNHDSMTLFVIRFERYISKYVCHNQDIKPSMYHLYVVTLTSYVGEVLIISCCAVYIPERIS